MQFLPEDTALLEFHMSRTFSTQDYCIFLVTSSNVSCIRLGDRRKLEELVDEWYRLYITSAHVGPTNMDGMAELKKNRRVLDTKLRRLLYRPIEALIATLPAELSIKRLIISLWQINDRSGYYFMQAFYENLVRMPDHPKHAFFLATVSIHSAFYPKFKYSSLLCL